VAALVPVVEGRGEVAAVPVLVRRVLAAANLHHVPVARPVLGKRNQIVLPGEFERRLAIAERDREDAGAVLVLLDADDDCAVLLAQQLRPRAAAVSALPTAVVIAVREYEAWFLGAIESLRGARGIAVEAAAPLDPEARRDAKGAPSGAMTGARRYVEVADQPALSAAMDLDVAESACPSFAKFRRDVLALAARC